MFDRDVPGGPIPELVPVPGGVFTMGSDTRRRDERPARVVEVASFRAAREPVTNAQYRPFVEAGGAAAPPWAVEGFDEPTQPVVGVNWFEAAAYCEWLAGQTGTPFRLPTEAEREYAARGGVTSGDWPWDGASHPAVEEIASLGRPHTPLPACENGYGLRCMAENVHEWCTDWYDPEYYAVAPRQNPVGPASGSRRASRGGAWRHAVKFTRINARSSLPPEFRYNDYGFRVYADG
ncbi:MAG: formylglycine-generating enzyme family protein [Tepidiformaceae bacterium]